MRHKAWVRDLAGCRTALDSATGNAYSHAAMSVFPRNPLGLACFALLAGCYSYRGGTVPVVSPQAIMAPRVERVIVYNLRVTSNTGGELDAQGAVRRALEENLRLAGADLKPSGQPGGDYDMLVELRTHGSVPAQILSGFISGFTFTIIPAYASVDVQLHAGVTSRDGVVHRYQYHDRQILWIQLFLLPIGNNPDRVAEALLADMTRSLARDMQRDGLLPAPGGTTTDTFRAP